MIRVISNGDTSDFKISGNAEEVAREYAALTLALKDKYYPIYDYALWLTILRKGYTAHGIQEPLAIYRSHNGVSKGNKLAFLKYHYQMFHHILGYNCLMAGILTIRNSIFYFIYRFIDTQ